MMEQSLTQLSILLLPHLYGRKVRQPIGGEFGFSSRLIDIFLRKRVKTTEVTRFGIDIWMTTITLAKELNVCQSFLGAKIHNHKDPSVSLAPMFRQVIGTIFELMNDYVDYWMNVDRISPVKTFGFGCTVIPEEIRVNQDALVRKFKEGFMEYENLWTGILPKQTFKRLCGLLNQHPEEFRFPKDLWVKVIYDFSAFYNSNLKKSVKNKSVLSLVPLYLGYTASFVNETRKADFYEAERNVERLCEKFLELKPYLISRWNGTTLRSEKPKSQKNKLAFAYK